MYSVESDAARQLLVISAVGRVTKEEVHAAAAEVRQLVPLFEPGFVALTDFRFLDSMEPAAATHIAEIMDALAAKGVRYVARVIPDSTKDIGFKILSRFHYGPQVQIATFENLAEAIVSLTEN
jgi:hypothetical protein